MMTGLFLSSNSWSVIFLRLNSILSNPYYTVRGIKVKLADLFKIRQPERVSISDHMALFGVDLAKLRGQRVEVHFALRVVRERLIALFCRPGVQP